MEMFDGTSIPGGLVFPRPNAAHAAFTSLFYLRRLYGLAGHWIKILLHHMFMYKARLMPGWQLIPE